MSFGLNLATANRTATSTSSVISGRRRPLLQLGTGPWANLGAPVWAPSSFTGGVGQRSFLFGGSAKTSYQLFKMLPTLTICGQRRPAVVKDTCESSSDGDHESDGDTTELALALTQDPSDDPLDLSSSGRVQEVAASVEREEVRRRNAPSPETCVAPSPESEPVPMDLSSQKGNSINSDQIGDRDSSAAPEVVEAEIEDLKAEIRDLQEKLERSRDNYSKKVLQMEKYSMGETTALLKAICWKGRLHLEYDDLPIRRLPVRMKSALFWDEDFRGQGSLLGKFRENLRGKRDRDCVSIKRKWSRIFKSIARKPHDFFEQHCRVGRMGDDDKMFLIKLAKEYCKMKGIDIQNQRLGSASQSGLPTRPPSRDSVPQPAPSSHGNPFLDEDDFRRGWRDMPVLMVSQGSRSRFN